MSKKSQNLSSSPVPNPHPYADILHHSRPVTTQTPLSIAQRAAQFAPYATLSGHRDIILQDELDSATAVARTIIPDDNFYDDPFDAQQGITS